MQENNADTGNDKRRSMVGTLLSDREKKSLLAYIAIGIILVEFVVTVVAILHGVTNLEKMPDGTVSYEFPWKAYIIGLFIAPVAVMFITQMVGVCFSRLMGGDSATEQVKEQLPKRLRRWLTMAQGLPTLILLAGVLLLGGLLYKLDIIMATLVSFGTAAMKIAMWVGIAVFIAWLASYFAKLFLMYKTRKLQEEYAFRREVLEKTGIAIIDDKTALTADGKLIKALGSEHTATEITPVTALGVSRRSLPQGSDSSKADTDANDTIDISSDSPKN